MSTTVRHELPAGLVPLPRHGAHLPLVAVLVGTDHHRFDRVVDWAHDLATTGRHRWFVQHGTSPLPTGLPGADVLALDDLTDLLRRADVVVTHGGPGLVMEARALGHRPVVVPRDPALGEHVDDHQLRFARRIAEAGMVTLATDRDAFSRALESTARHGRSQPAAASAPAAPHAASARFGRLVDQLLQQR